MNKSKGKRRTDDTEASVKNKKKESHTVADVSEVMLSNTVAHVQHFIINFVSHRTHQYHRVRSLRS